MRKTLVRPLRSLAIALALLVILQALEHFTYSRFRSFYVPTSQFSPKRAFLLDGELNRGTVAIYKGQEYVGRPDQEQSAVIAEVRKRHPNSFDPKLIAWQLDDNEDYLWYFLHPNWGASLAFLLLASPIAFLALRREPHQSPYLKPGRLNDVLALVQVLAVDGRANRTESGIATALKQKPMSANSWTELASEHGELFRVGPNSAFPISLVLRYANNTSDNSSPPCSEDQLSRLMALATDIHDRAVTRSHRWHIFVPVVASASAAIISALAALAKK